MDANQKIFGECTTDAISLGGKREAGAEFVRMYFEHQYNRMAKLEEQGLSITNIVITLNIVAFTFGFSNVQDLTVITGFGLPFMMVISNIFAIAYICVMSKYIRVHQRRAKRVLKFYAQDLYKLDKSIPHPHRGGVGRRRWIQLLIHTLLAFVALIPAYIYLQGIL